MPKYLSGRVKRRDQAYLSTDRYQFLGLEQAEPNLGDSPSLTGSPNIPAGQQYQIVSLIERPGERFWVPIGGGVIPGSISIFDEGSIVGTLNSITQLNFTGNAITASPSDLRETTITLKNSETFSFTKSLVVSQASSSATGVVKFATTNSGIVTLTNVSGTFDGTGVLKQDNVAIGQTPTDAGTVVEITGVGVTIRVAPSGNENEVLFVGSDDFSTDTRFSFVDGLLNTGDKITVGIGGTVITTTDTGKVGIGSTTPIAKLDMNVGSAFTAVNVIGTEGQLLLITDEISSGSIFAVNDVSGMPSIDVDASGTIQLAPFGVNEFVGIGTTNPISKLHVVGDTNIAGNLNVTGVSTFADDIFIGVGATVGFGTTAYFGDNARAVFGDGGDLEVYHDSENSYIQDTGTGNLFIDSSYLTLRNGAGNQIVASFTHGTGVAGGVQLYFENSKKFQTRKEGILVSGGTTTGEFKATGVSTFKDDVEFHGALGIASVTFDKSDNSLKFVESAKLKLGSNLEIFQDTSGTSRIHATDGSNRLQFRATDFRIAGSNGLKNILRAEAGASVKLYYDNVIRFATSGIGATVFGQLDTTTLNVSGVSTFAGNVAIGTDNPDQKLHVYNGAGDVISFVEAIAGDALLNLSNSGDGNYSGINFIRERSDGSRNGGSIFMPSNDGNNEAFLYIQAQSTNAEAGVTDALSANNGVRLKLHGDDGIFSIETGSEERFRIDNNGKVGIGSTTPISKLDVFGQTELDDLNVSGVSTFADDIFVGVGATVGFGTTAYFRDNARAVFGDDEDLSIYHDGEQSILSEQGTGGFRILTSTFRVKNPGDNSTFISAAGSYVVLNHNGDQRLKTTEEGVLVSGGTTTGDFKATGVSTFTGNIVPATTNSVNIGEDVNLQFNKIFANEFIGQINTVQENQEVGNLQVNGISTFIGVSTFADGIHVISGISTFDGNIDANQNLDVDGTTTLDDTTIDGLLDINAGGQANTFKVEDLTEDRVVIVGTGGELEDSANLTFNGSTLTVTGTIDANGDLDVDGHTELDDLNVSGFSTFVGNAEFKGNVSIAGTLTYEDVTNVDSIGIITARKDIHVGAGVSAVGVGSFGSLVVGGGTTLESSTSTGTGKALKIISPSGYIEVGSQNTNNAHFYTDRPRFYFNKRVLVDEGIIGSFDEDLAFVTDQSEERIRIKNDTGNVGIGTITPDQKLHVVQKSTDSYGTGVARFEYYDTNDAGGDQHYDAKFVPTGTYIKSFITGSGTDFLIVDADNVAGRHSFAVEGNAGNNKSFTVDSTGLVGVGTDNPQTTLEVVGAGVSVFTDSKNAAVEIGNGRIELSRTDSVAFIDFKTGSIEDFDCRIQQFSNGLRFYTGGQGSTGERLRITSGGDVGIGTINPTATNALTNNNSTLAVGIVTTNSLFSRDLKVSGISTFAGITTVTGETFFTKQLNVAGISTFGGDVSIAEKIVHTGDTNTNISFPDDDTILFKTNNYDRLRIHKNQYLVSVGSTGDIANPTNSRFRIGGRRINQAGAFATLEFMNGLFSSGGGSGDARATASIRASRDTDNYGVALTFHTAAGNPTGLSDGDFERLRIGRDGRVVIETGPLFVPNQIKHKDDEHTLIEFDEDTINFDTGGTQRLRINSDGNAIFSGNIDANGDLDVNGRTELDITNISETLNVTGISTFQDDVFVGTGATVGFGTTAYFRDNAKAIFGDGEDLSIYHSGERSYIQDTGQGTLTLDTNGFAIKLTYNDSENMLRAIRNEAVELYFDNSLKLSTTKEGVLVSGGTTTGDFKATGVSTFTGLVNIDGGGQANTFKVEDLTDNRIVIAGTGGELEDSANLTFNGSTLAVTGDIDANGDLDVDGTANLDDVNIAGIATLSSGAFPNNVSVGERTYQTNVDIRVSSLRSGIVVRNMNNFRTDNTFNSAFMVLDPFTNSAKTFAFRAAEGIGANDITTDSGYSANTATLSDTFWVKTNGDAYFSGKVGIGSTTPQDILTLRTGDDVTSLRLIDPTNDTYGGHFSFYNTANEVRIGGINNGTKRATIRIDRDANDNCLVIDGSNDTTFRGSLFRSSSSQDIGTPSNPWNKVYASEFIGLINTAQENVTTGNLLVTGIATFQGNVSIAGTLTYEDVTNIDSLGIITARTDVHVGAGLSVVGVSTFKSDIKVTAGNTLTLNSNASDPVIKIQGSGPNFITFASDAPGNVDSDSINLVYRSTPNTLGFERASDNTIFFTVDADDGLVTVSNNLNVVSDLDVDGTANLDDVDIDGDLDVDGHTDLDNVNIAGVTTISSQLNLDTTGEGIKFGSGTAGNDDAHIEWLGGNNAGYLRISTSDDSDNSNANEYIEFGDYAQTNKVGTFTQHLRIARDQFLVRTGAHNVAQADRFIIDSVGKIGIKTTTPTAQLSIGNTTGSYMNLPGIQVNRPHSLGLQNGIHVYTDNSYNQTADYQTAAFKATAVSGIAFAASTDAGSDGKGGTLNARIKFDGAAYFAGNTGIGTDNPDQKLHVYNGAGDVTSFVEAIAGDAILDLSNTGNANYSGINFTRERSDGSRNGGSIFMPSNTSNNEAFLYIQAQSTSSQAGQTGALSDNNGVRLKLHGDDGIFSIETGSEERLRIDNNGDVGIGTDNPQEKLHIHEGDIVIGQVSGNNTNTRNYIKFGRVSAPKAAIGFINSTGNGRGDIIFMNNNDVNSAGFGNNDEVFRITHDGNVGIGTDNPAAKLEAYGTDASIIVHNQGESRGGIAGFENQRLAFVSTHVNDDLVFGYSNNPPSTANFVERFRIDNGTGNVGIGTIDPSARLHIGPQNGDSTHHVYLASGNNDYGFLIDVQDYGAGNVPLRIFNRRNNNDTEVIRVTQDGDVGIGTAIPTDAVTNDITAKLAVGIVTANEYFGTFKGNIDPGVPITNANNVNITDDTSASGTHYIHFGSATSGYDGVEVDSTGLVYKDSQFGLGTNSPGASLHISTTLPRIRLTDTDNSNIDHFISGSGSALHFQADENQEDGATATTIRFSIDAEERLRIDANGLVGIGTGADLGDARLTAEGVTALTNVDQTVMVRDSNSDDAVGRGGNIGFGAYVDGTMRTLAAIGGLKKNSGNSFNGNLALYTRRSGQATLDQRLTILSTGEVGINDTNPSSTLTVAGDVSITRGTTSSGLTRTLSIGGARNQGSNFASIDLKNYDSDSTPVADYVAARITGTVPSTPNNGGELVFFTSQTGSGVTVEERLRIGSSGITSITGEDDQDNFIVDVAGTQFAVHTDATDGEISLRAQDGTGSNNSKFITFFTQESGSAAAEKVRIASDGKVGIGTNPQYNLHVVGTAAATNFDSLSDRRYKTNIKVIENPIEKIKKIDGVSFNWKETNEPSLGVIADDVLEVLPEIVSGKDTKSVNYNGLIGVLIEVVKDQQKQIDELRGLLDK